MKDGQNNVIAIMRGSDIVAQYWYDAWGNILQEFKDSSDYFAVNNPFRYRSYYYDIETGLYYLQTRYYDPEIGAFISPDSVDYLDPETIGGLSLYTYCLNNPVMYVDPSGNFFLLGFIIGAVIGAAVGFGAVAYMDYQDDGEIFNGSIAWQAYLGATLFGGAVGGILGGYVLPALSQMSFSIPTGLKVLTDTVGFSHVVVTSSITITGGQVLAGAGAIGILVMAHEGKKAAPRVKCKSKKEAYDKAFYKGGKKEPIYHNDKHGKHFHPNDPRFKHWHYFFPILAIIINKIKEYFE